MKLRVRISREKAFRWFLGNKKDRNNVERGIIERNLARRLGARPKKRFNFFQDGPEELVEFYCPGCGYGHQFIVTSDSNPAWTWNGDLTFGTFSPSLLYCPNDPNCRCHSYVREGRIEYLGDCWHELKNQTVDVPDWE